MIIEGENLEVLKCLLSAYREKIKCIYIDPPYNTGNDFVYSDNYSEQRKAYWEQTGVTEDGVKVDTNSESAGRYHSNWLNMMYPRLLAARQLLREDGVIFISIDDHEVHHLRKLCDEVFGEDGFIANVVWQKRTSPDSRLQLGPGHDHVLVYSKQQIITKEFFKPIPLSDGRQEDYKNPDNDPRGVWASADLTGQTGHATKDQFYEIVSPKGSKFSPPEGRCWSYAKKTIDELIKDNRIWFGRNGTSRPRQKNFLSESEGTSCWTWWTNQEVGHNQEATKEFNDLMECGDVFTNPKPTRLLDRIVRLATDENDMTLDFFAGSGTTGQAVMDLNMEDGGNRKFILVQLPERTDEKSEAFKAGYKKISDITIERNKRVIDRIAQEQAEGQQQGLFEQGQVPYKPGFKSYRLVKSHFPRVEFQPDPDKTAEENIALLKQYIIDKEATLYSLFNEADIFDEVMLKNGFQLNFSRESLTEFTSNSVYRVTDGHKTALVCLDPELNDTTVVALNGRDEIFICLERAVDTTKKWNLKHQLGEKLVAF